MAKFHAFFFHKYNVAVFTVRYHRFDGIGSSADSYWFVPGTYNGE